MCPFESGQGHHCRLRYPGLGWADEKKAFASDKADYETMVTEYQTKITNKVNTLLQTEKFWKRRAKYSGAEFATYHRDA